MIHLTINEHERIFRLNDSADGIPNNGRTYLKDKYFRLLEKFDRSYGSGEDGVFTWYVDHVQARQWVGIIQLPGLMLEILPKIDTGELSDNKEKRYEARKNLLYMLSISGDVPVRSRDMAKISSRKAPLSETLCALFANRLLSEILKGVDRSYIEKEENIRGFKGHLVLNKHLLRNAAHRERFFCRFDDFSSDTPLNQVFKAAVTVMLGISHMHATQDTLRNCLLAMDQVKDVAYPKNLFDKIAINRQNRRFEDLYEFSRLILTGYSSTVSPGKKRNFSLLFDMNILFERFVAGFIQKHVITELFQYQLFPQAIHHRRHLMQISPNRGILNLAPDILIKNPAKQFLVMDTKWKKTNGHGRTGGVKNSDLYQLFAYTHRYGCGKSILLYPKTEDSSARDFDILDDTDTPCGKQVCVRFVDLNRNLYSEVERVRLTQELKKIVEDGFELYQKDNGVEPEVLYALTGRV